MAEALRAIRAEVKDIRRESEQALLETRQALQRMALWQEEHDRRIALRYEEEDRRRALREEEEDRKRALRQEEHERNMAKLEAASEKHARDLAAFRASQEDAAARHDRETAEFRARREEAAARHDREIAEIRALQKANDDRIAEFNRGMAELKKQLGGLGEKFGGFTEGMALPSMEKVLRERFGLEKVFPRPRVRRAEGRTMEVDVLAYSDSRPEAFIVGVKSHLRAEALAQILKALREVREFYPELGERKFFGIIAYVDAPEALCKKILEKGIYLARIHDETFEIAVPEGFKPRSF